MSDELFSALLAKRGITTSEEREAFLHPSYNAHLHDPLLMTDMEKGAKRLAEAILRGERICGWTDYDGDGTPAAVLLHDFLKKVGANFEIYIPHRHLEGYGVNSTGVEKLAERGTRLIVTADSGITDLEAVARARELGIDVIVTDHHLPGKKLPDAFAVINPNAREDEPYPFKGLCGAGVAFKLVCATLEVAPEIRKRVPEGWEKWLLDMVGLATISDMVPLTGENRVLATFGLTVLRRSPRIGLARLCRALRLDQRALSEDDVGFMLTPRVNAASRMGDARDVFELFTTSDESEAERLAKKLEEYNRARKASAGAITRAVHEKLRVRADVPSVIALGDPEWRPGLLGLVANTIAEEFDRPVFLWGREGNMTLKGSVRGGGRAHVLLLMQAATHLFSEFGGHAASGGFTLRDEAVFTLQDELCKAYEQLEKNEGGKEVSHDAQLSLAHITPHFFEKLSRLAPFGMGNPKPLFLLSGCVAASISYFGKNKEHIKLALVAPDTSQRIEAVAFFAKNALTKKLQSLQGAPGSALLVHVERDTFSRRFPLRLRLIDIVNA